MIQVAVAFDGVTGLGTVTGNGQLAVTVSFPNVQVGSNTLDDTIDNHLGISESGNENKYLNQQGDWKVILNTVGGLNNVDNAVDSSGNGLYLWQVSSGTFSLSPFTVDFSNYYTRTETYELLGIEATARGAVATALGAHVADENNPHKTSLEKARTEDNFFSGDVDMNNNRLQNLPAASADSEPATYGQLKQFIDTTIKALEGYNPSSGNYPATYGGNAIKKGDSFKITATGTVHSINVTAGDFLIALVNVPGQTDSNWEIGQANLDQATESVPGIAMLAAQSEAENELTSENTKIVTPQKLWFGIARMTQIAWTWALKQIFTTAPRFSSAGASQYLKVDGSKDLTSVNAIPASDVTEDSSHRFTTDSEKTTWNAKAPVNSPALTGTPTAPTASANSNSTQLATTAYVDSSMNTINQVGSKLYLFYNY